jgi:hypothetical protein
MVAEKARSKKVFLETRHVGGEEEEEERGKYMPSPHLLQQRNNEQSNKLP